MRYLASVLLLVVGIVFSIPAHAQTVGASFTGMINGFTLTVTALKSGAVTQGQTVLGSGVTNGTTIVGLGTGAGGVGTYTVSISQTVSSRAMTSQSGGTVGLAQVIANAPPTAGPPWASTDKFLMAQGDPNNPTLTSIAADNMLSFTGGMSKTADNATLPNVRSNIGLGTADSPVFSALSLAAKSALINATDPYLTAKHTNDALVLKIDRNNPSASGGGNAFAALTLNDLAAGTHSQPVAVAGLGFVGSPTNPGFSNGNYVFGGNFQGILNDTGTAIGTEINSENNIGPPSAVLPPDLSYEPADPTLVGLSLVAEGLFDSNVALNIGAHVTEPQFAHWLTGIYIKHGRVLNNGIYVDAVSGETGSPIVSATLRNSGFGALGVNKNLVLQTMGTYTAGGTVVQVLDKDDNIKLSILQSGDLLSTGTSLFTRYGALHVGDDTTVAHHILSGQQTPPALTSCGTDPPPVTGSDTAGTVTMGTSASGCVITFDSGYGTAPHCVVTWRNTPLASQSYAVSASAITLTQTSTSGNKVDYVCVGPG